jgi:hypothetical protein
MNNIFWSEECNPPCWKGITPGTTNKEDVLMVFGEDSIEHRYNGVIGSDQFVENFVLPDSKYINNQTLTEYRVEFSSQALGTIILIDETVVTIEFNVNCTLADVINKIDEPDYVILTRSRYGVMIANLFYLNKGIRVEIAGDSDSWETSNKDARIDPHNEVLEITFHPVIKNENEQNIIDWIWYDTYYIREEIYNIQIWHGYREYYLISK